MKAAFGYEFIYGVRTTAWAIRASYRSTLLYDNFTSNDLTFLYVLRVFESLGSNYFFYKDQSRYYV